MKKCQFCDSELPDEASFCLNCSSVINNREELAIPGKKHSLYKIIPLICCFILLVLSLSTVSLYRANRFPSQSPPSDEPQTTFVPATRENGEIVTDAHGNTVYEAVTLESTTEKSVFSNIIDNIFGKDESHDENTEPQSDGSNTTDPPSDITVTTSFPVPPTEPSSTTEKDDAIAENPAEVFEYEPYENSTTNISITKYKGNASFVTIPDYINGLMVVEIKKDAFSNNSKIKTIDIIKGKRTYIWLRSQCFNNLSSLTTVNLYDNDLGMRGDFAVDCPIKNFNITYWQYKFVNGAIYAYNSKEWELKTFCGNPCYTVLTMEPWCKKISNDNNLRYSKNLKVINAHKNTTSIPIFPGDYPKNLEAINVEEGNEIYMSKDGVLFNRRHTSSGYVNIYDAYYPASKKDKMFTMPQKEGFTFYLNANTSVINPYVEEIYLPLNASIGIGVRASSFPNLKRLYIAKDNTCYDKIRFEYTGEIILY